MSHTDNTLPVLGDEPLQTVREALASISIALAALSGGPKGDFGPEVIHRAVLELENAHCCLCHLEDELHAKGGVS